MISLAANLFPFVTSNAWGWPLSPEACWMVLVAIAHTLWQGAILAGVVALMVHFRIPRSVSSRFTACFVCLFLLGTAPVANILWLQSHKHTPAEITSAQISFHQQGRLPLFRVCELQAASSSGAAPKSVPLESSVIPQPTLNLAASVSSLAGARQDSSRAPSLNWTLLASVFVTLAYLAGVLIMLARLIVVLSHSRQLSKMGHRSVHHWQLPRAIEAAAERAAAALGCTLHTPLAMFSGRGSAIVVGIFRPVIFINTALATGLTPGQLEQIIAHELAHIYRWDPITQLIQRTIESTVFFHPATWFISRHASTLREMCCDEIVGQRYSRHGYALALVECAELEIGSVAHPKPTLTLSSIGAGPSQLSSRIESLLTTTKHSSSKSAQSIRGFGSHQQRLIVLAPLALLIAWLTIWNGASLASWLPKSSAVAAAFLNSPLENNPWSNLHGSDQQPDASTITEHVDADWPWKTIPVQDISADRFMFGGTELSLSKTPAEDIKIHAMIDPADFGFGEWHFGDSASTRVAVLVEVRDGEILRIFIDQNRDRIFRANEELSIQTVDKKAWITPLSAEIRTGGRAVHSNRQIAISLKPVSGKLRINSLGYAEGKLAIGEKSVRTRRLDTDGDGLPTGPRDQILFDLDGDGKFAPLAERKLVRNFLQISGTRYSVFSDPFGQSLKINPAANPGSVQFLFSPKTADGQSAPINECVIDRLEGSLQDASGMLIAIRLNQGRIEVPVGRFCISNLLVQVRDQEGTLWRATFARGRNRGWFEIEANQKIDIKLLDRIEFAVSSVSQESNWSQQTYLQPSLYTNNGLVMTNFVRITSGKNDPNKPNGDAVLANFETFEANHREEEPLTATTCYG